MDLLAVELLRVLEQVDEGVDELGRVVLVGYHGIGLHLPKIAVPEAEKLNELWSGLEPWTVCLCANVGKCEKCTEPDKTAGSIFRI